MSTGVSSRATVLVVDDEQEVADVYALQLENDYDVRVAYGGEAALEAIDDDVDVVLLDRRMPDLSGDEVLDRIRERDIDARVVVVTAVEPDFDIITMEFDDYLVKPVGRRRLVETVDHMLSRARYSDLLDEFYRTANKIATLEAAKSPEELADSEEFERLQDHARDLQQQVTRTLQELDDYAGAFHEVERIPALTDEAGDSGGDEAA